MRAALALSLPPVLALRVGLDVLRRALGVLRWLVRRVLELQVGVRRLRTEGCSTGWEGTLILFRGFVQLQSAWRLQVGGPRPASTGGTRADHLEAGGSTGSHFFSIDSGLTPLVYEPSFSTRGGSKASASTGGVTIGSHVRALSDGSNEILPAKSGGPSGRGGVPPMWQSVSYGAIRSHCPPAGEAPPDARYGADTAAAGDSSQRALTLPSQSLSRSKSFSDSPTFSSFSRRVAFFEAGDPGGAAAAKPLREVNRVAALRSSTKALPDEARQQASAGREKENATAGSA